MNRVQQGLTIAGAMAMVLGSTLAYADSNGTATSLTAVTTAQSSAESEFAVRYQRNLQEEAALLQKAQQGQSPYASQFSTFVTTVSTQVTSVYASEQALAQLGFTWGKDINGNPLGGLTKREDALQVQLKDMQKKIKQDKGKGKGKENRGDAQEAKAAKDIQKQLSLIGQEIRFASHMDVKSPVKYFAQNVASLRQTILGLQADEIRVTQAWIASESVTGTVYGSNNTTSTNVTVTVQTNGQ